MKSLPLWSNWNTPEQNLKKLLTCTKVPKLLFMLQDRLQRKNSVRTMDLISLAVDGVAGFSKEIVKFFAITGVISVILIFLR
jgi:hypothetical protein